jgi:hypothetical protein
MEVDVPLVIDLLKHLGHYRHVVRIGCTDELIVLDIQLGPKVPEQGTDFINVIARGNIFLFCRPHDLISVLIRAGKEVGIVGHHAMVPIDHIGAERGIGMP